MKCPSSACKSGDHFKIWLCIWEHTLISDISFVLFNMTAAHSWPRHSIQREVTSKDTIVDSTSSRLVLILSHCFYAVFSRSRLSMLFYSQCNLHQSDLLFLLSKVLDIHENKLTSLPEDIGKLATLQVRLPITNHQLHRKWMSMAATYHHLIILILRF